MHLVFNKLTEENLRQLGSNGYSGKVETCFEFVSGQGNNLFIDVHSFAGLDKDEKDFILFVSCALLTGGARVKEELTNMVYESGQILVTLDRFQHGNVEHLSGVKWDDFQPFKSGWLVTCDPATEIEALIFCEKKPLSTSPAGKMVSLPVLH